MFKNIFFFGILFNLLNCSTTAKNKFIERQLSQETTLNEGPKPDYSKPEFWAAIPGKESPALDVPNGVEKNNSKKEVDVFFIHPTTYMNDQENDLMGAAKKRPLKALKAIKNSPWNADLSNEKINISTDTLTLKYQASAFNESANIYAPRYRQANIKAFAVKDSKQSQQAFDMAYADVKAAFEYYLQNYNQGKPIIIASHSQGSLMAIRLLKEFFDEKALYSKLVCAYIVGQAVPAGTFKAIPLGINAHQTGCFVAWQSFNDAVGISDKVAQQRQSQGINPITWTAETTWTKPDQHHGALLNFNRIQPHAISTQLDKDGLLLVKMPETWGEKMLKRDNLHFYDYHLFWQDIRDNVKQRIADFYL